MDGARLEIALIDDGQAAGRPPAPQPAGGPGSSPAAQPTGPTPGPGPTPAGGPRLIPQFLTPVEIVTPIPVPVTMAGGTGGASGPEGEQEEPSRLRIAAEAVAKGFDVLATGARRAAETLVPLAVNDHMGALAASADAAGKALSYIPEVGGALQSSIKSVVGVFQAAGAVITAFVDRGKELADYSPQLAQAGAQSEIKTILTDIREANEIGPGLARLTDASADLQREFTLLMLPIKKFVVEVLAGLMEAIVSGVQAVAVWTEKTYAILQDLPGIISQVLTLDLAGAKESIRIILKVIDERLKREKTDDGKDQLDLTMEQMFNRMAGRAPVHPLGGGAP